MIVFSMIAMLIVVLTILSLLSCRFYLKKDKADDQSLIIDDDYNDATKKEQQIV